MTGTAINRGIKNALICSIGMIATIGLGALGVSSITGRSVRSSAGLVFVVLYVILMASSIIWGLRARNTRGGVILDCGPHPMRWLFILCAALFFISGMLGLLLPFSTRSVWAVGGPALMLVGVPFYLALGTGRLQITQRGIWSYWALLRWEKITSCRWASDATLKIESKSWFGLTGRGALPVPPEQREAVNDFLVGHGVFVTA